MSYALQILSIKGECTFPLLNFMIISLRNFSGNSLLEIFLFLIADFIYKRSGPTRCFYQNIYRPSKQVHVDIHFSLFLAILNFVILLHTLLYCCSI